jgi:hypothetical protein
MESEWAWVTAAANGVRPMLWKVRRLCIQLDAPSGGQVTYAEEIAAKRFGEVRYLTSMSEDELWLLISELRRLLNQKEEQAA